VAEIVEKATDAGPLAQLIEPAGQLIAASGLLILVTPLAGMQPITFPADATTTLLVLGILGPGSPTS
jgi:proteasome assembly chaperone (PAC2) family protein